MNFQLETPRLILRTWEESDLQPFAKMSQDKEVMRYFPHPLNSSESYNLASLIQRFIQQQA